MHVLATPIFAAVFGPKGPEAVAMRRILVLIVALAWCRCYLSPRGGRVARRASVQELQSSLLRIAAALDRGQAYNPTSGDYYAERMVVARDLVEQLVQQGGQNFTLQARQVFIRQAAWRTWMASGS